jgi:hypothetical protein
MGIGVIGIIFILVLFLVVLLGMLPEFRSSNAEIRMHIGLVPEDTVFNLIGLTGIVNDKAFEILCTLVHDLTEKLKIGEGRAIVIKNTLSV